MSISTEALAMAGADYLEWGMDAEEWENEDLHQLLSPPPHMLAEEEVTKEGACDKNGFLFTYYSFPRHPLEDDNDGGGGGGSGGGEDDNGTADSHSKWCQYLRNLEICWMPDFSWFLLLMVKVTVKLFEGCCRVMNMISQISPSNSKP